jgi:Mrp family chromosome partitioning ATPase
LLWSVVVGLILGAIGVLVLNHRVGEVRTAIDLSTLRSTEPVLAVVPRDSSSQASPVVVRQPVGRAIDAYAELRSAVQRMMRDRGVRVVQFSSPNDGEGATAAAVNLAIVMARSGTRVVIVDLDLRSPRVHTMLGVPRSPGVVDTLADHRAGPDQLNALERLARFDSYDDLAPPARADAGTGEPVDHVVDDAVDDAVHDDRDFDDLDDFDPPPLAIPAVLFEDNLAVLPAGSPARSALEVLSRRRMDELFADLREWYDLVIVASPATLTSGDAAAVARHADGTVMVVKAGSSSLSVVRQALGTIDRAGSRILGVLLTGSNS